MDEEYELILKSELHKLKTENQELKNKLNNHESDKDNLIKEKNNQNIENDLSKFIEKNKNEQEQILKNLAEIKDLNMQTLDNVLTKSEELNKRIDPIVKSIQELVKLFSRLIEEMPKEETLLKEINKINLPIQNINSKINSEKSLEIITNKLNEIDTFMKNLRILLSYVKPSTIQIDKNTNSSTNSQLKQNNIPNPPKNT